MRRVVVAIAAGVAVASVGLSAAWACSVQIGMRPLSVLVGPPGTEVTVTGISPGTQVDLRWDGVRGPVLATTAVDASVQPTGTFSAEIKIPDAEPGIHYVVAVDNRIAANGNPEWSRAAFKIPGPSSANPGTDVQLGDQAQQLRPAGEALWGTEPGQPDAPSHPPSALGFALLGFGAAGLMAAFAVLAVCRVRVRARGNTAD